MKNAEQIAKWVIDNRRVRKITDFKMYSDLVDYIKTLSEKETEVCDICDWVDLPDKTSICRKCGTTAPF